MCDIFEQISSSLAFGQRQDKMKKHLWVISHHPFQPVHVVGYPEPKQLLNWTNFFSPRINSWLIGSAATISPGDDSKQCFSSSNSDWRIFFSKAAHGKIFGKKQTNNCKTLFLLTCKPSAPQSHPDSCPPHRPGNLQQKKDYEIQKMNEKFTSKVTCNKKRIKQYKKWKKSSTARLPATKKDQ